MVEAAFDFLDHIKVPHSPTRLLTLASRNYSVHGDLAGYLSPESSLDRTIGLLATGYTNCQSNESSSLESKSRNDVSKPNQNSLIRTSQSSEGVNSKELEINNIEAKYYCSTDEPEPWDLIKLNLQASYICLSAKVNALSSAGPRVVSSPSSDKLAPLAHIDGLSSLGSCDLLTTTTAATTPDISPTEDDSGIGMDRGISTPESERTHQQGQQQLQDNFVLKKENINAIPFGEKYYCDESSHNCCSSGDSLDGCIKPKLASIMETSREDTIDSDDSNHDLTNTRNVQRDLTCKLRASPLVSSDISSKSISSTISLSVSKDIEKKEVSNSSSVNNDNCSNITTNTNILLHKSSVIYSSTGNDDSLLNSSCEDNEIRLQTASVVPESSYQTRPIVTTGSHQTSASSSPHHSNTLQPAASLSTAPHDTNGVASDSLSSIVPSIVKLRGAVDGAVRTARLVHSVHRLQQPTDAIHQTHALQYRRDVCFAQAVRLF